MEINVLSMVLGLLVVSPGVFLWIQRILLRLLKSALFVTTTIVEMDNSNKRFILYYWYVTNVYSITGSKHRMKLPKYLVPVIGQ
jgi:hypothetical protein